MSLDISRDRKPAGAQPHGAAAAGVLLLLLAGAAQAFPESAAALTPDDLRSRLADKVFDVKPASGPPWRMEFKANGYFFINVGQFRDDGPWRVKDSALCTSGKQMRDSCNEVRLVGADLVLQRDSGELVTLAPR